MSYSDGGLDHPQRRADAVDAAIDAFVQAPTAARARAKLRAVIDEYARGKLGDVADVAHEATMALAARRLTGTSTLPAFVKMLRERGRTDAQLEAMLADVFEGVVTHLHTRGDPETSIHTCQAADTAHVEAEVAQRLEAVRPTPDEARRLVSAAISAGIGLACHGNWTDEQRRAADERAEAARAALLRALGVV